MTYFGIFRRNKLLRMTPFGIFGGVKLSRFGFVSRKFLPLKFKNEPQFNGVYSRDNLAKIKDGTYIRNLDEYSDIGTHWVALWVNNNVTYFDSFGIEHIPKEIKILK